MFYMDDIPRRSVFQTIVGGLPFVARLTFAATVILIPVRFRLVLLARPSALIGADYTNFLLFAADVSLLITLAIWLVSLILSPRKLSLGPRHIWIPLMGLTLAGWISAISSFDPWLSIYNAIRLIILFWFYFYVVNEIRSARWVLIPVGLQISLQSIVALAQFIAQRSVGLQRIGEQKLNPAWAGVSVVVSNGVRLLRAYGLSDHPNILGGSLAFGLLLMLAAYLQILKPFPILTAFNLAIPAWLVTFSRSAWLSFLGGAVIIVGVNLISRHRESVKQLGWLALSSLLLLAPFLLAYGKFFGTRLNIDHSFNTPSLEQQSIGERFLLINSALPIFFDHPWLGVGLGASTDSLKSYYPSFSAPYEPPHLSVFDAALETGVLGATFYLALLILPCVIFFKHRMSLLSNARASAALALLLSVTIVGFFDYYTWLLVPGRLWQWLAWGLWAAALSEASKESSPASQPPAFATA
jgi:O-Antigen ligase